MKTNVYACYLPGSEKPDYVGSHNAEPPERSCSLKWRYTNCVYLGQAVWVERASGKLLTLPRPNQNTKWGGLIAGMTPEERLNIRVETLATCDAADRWRVEAAIIRACKPPFNTMSLRPPDTKAEKQAKLNAYQRGYMPRYLAAHPAFAARKREADKMRARARRAALKEARSITK